MITANTNNTENFTITTLENGTKSIKANFTADNLNKAIEIINTATDKADYSKAVIAYVMTEPFRGSSDKSDKKMLKEIKEDLVHDMRLKDTAVLDKYIAVAENFIDLDGDLFVGRWDRDENGHTVPSLDLNFKAVHAIKDKFGFEFSLSALQEMLWLKDKDGNVDTQKLTELIADGKLKASMPSANKKTGIRAVINENKLKALETTADDTTSDSKDNKTDDKTDDKETIVFTKSSNKERAIAIQNVMNGITDDTFINSEFVKNFTEFLSEYIKNVK